MTPTRQNVQDREESAPPDPEATDVGPSIPDELLRDLRPWVDVAEVGLDGLWPWLQRILPLLGDVGASPPVGSQTASRPEDRVRELARALVDLESDRARLTMLCAEYFDDNRRLALRAKALEAILAMDRRPDPSAVPAPEGTTERMDRRYLGQ
jgi:hypothetical protein